MADDKVEVFFYGSYMNVDVLREVHLVPENVERATVAGFDIRIAPRANLVRSNAHLVHGIVASATHAELDRLYAHSREVLGETYLPEAVLARADSGRHCSVLCYICPRMAPRPAEAAYVGRIVAAARRFGFPEEYIERLLSFAPHDPQG